MVLDDHAARSAQRGELGVVGGLELVAVRAHVVEVDRDDDVAGGRLLAGLAGGADGDGAVVPDGRGLGDVGELDGIARVGGTCGGALRLAQNECDDDDEHDDRGDEPADRDHPVPLLARLLLLAHLDGLDPGLVAPLGLVGTWIVGGHGSASV